MPQKTFDQEFYRLVGENGRPYQRTFLAYESQPIAQLFHHSPFDVLHQYEGSSFLEERVRETPTFLESHDLYIDQTVKLDFKGVFFAGPIPLQLFLVELRFSEFTLLPFFLLTTKTEDGVYRFMEHLPIPPHVKLTSQYEDGTQIYPTFFEYSKPQPFDIVDFLRRSKDAS